MELREAEELKKEVTEHIQTMFQGILDYCDVAVPNENRYIKLRAKILRHGNNCIRNLTKLIDNKKLNDIIN